MNGSGEGAYQGRYTDEPDPDKGPRLEKAIRNAYKKAREQNPNAPAFKIVGIKIEGNNPITDYIVDLDDA